MLSVPMGLSVTQSLFLSLLMATVGALCIVTNSYLRHLKDSEAQP